jgi:sterol 3beta-glucosyltransferase
MRIVILTVGTRGDVQPYVALALGLQRAGHQVRLATHEIFRELVVGRGLDFASLGGNPQALLEAEAGRTWLESGNNPLRFVRQMIRVAGPLAQRVMTDCWSASQDADAILFSVFGFFVGYPVVEKLGVPGYAAFLQNATRTRTFPSMLSPVLPLGGGVQLADVCPDRSNALGSRPALRECGAARSFELAAPAAGVS